MWGRRLLYAAALLAALMGQLFDVGYLFHYIFFAAACLPLLGLALSLPAMLGCRAGLSLSAPRVGRGEQARWSLHLECRSPLPPARVACRLRFRDRMGGRERVQRLTMARPLPGSGRTWRAETDHCGLLECRVERLRVCDCLGLFALPVKAPPGGSLLVCPVPESPGPLHLPEGLGMPRPVPRGRSASGEDYELRPFRDGDSLRTVHWKMTAKRGELVTRELLEDRRPLPVLTFDHFGPREELDRTLDRLAGYSQALLERERPFQVRWAHPETGAVRCCEVSGGEDWSACLAAILSDPAPAAGASVLDRPLTVEQDQLLHHIHITGEEARHES